MDLIIEKEVPTSSTNTKEKTNIDKTASSIELQHEETSSVISRKRKLDNVESASKKLHIEGIGAVVASHYNNIEEKGLAHRNQSSIFYMRNFNNWIKSILIDHFITKTRKNNYGDFIVLDLGCGKGGDIFKWKKNCVKHVIFVDIAESSINQCRERYVTQRSRHSKLFTAEFFVTDFSKARLKNHFKNADTKFDFVSCQFALHYAFESLTQAEQAIRNISENLRSGGYFIATLPNAYKIMAESQKKASDSDENSSSSRNNFGNDVFKISFNQENNSSNNHLFGEKYHFSLEGVVDCPEFLVHLPTLVRICQKYDLECVYVDDFEDIFEKFKDDKFYLQLLHRMNCLQPIRKFSDEHKSDEFKCAERHLSRTNESSILSLSLSEWQAICLYLAVGFRKK